LNIADSSENDCDTNAFNCGIAFVDNTYDGTLTYAGNPAAGMGFYIGHLSSSSKEVNIKNLTGELSFGTRNLVQAMYINNDGNVGIGMASPSYKLDVDGTIYASGDVIMFSDERKKTHIETIPNALEKILQLRGVTFNKLDDDNRRHSGVIAQEVEKVLPEVVYTAEDDTKSVAYGNMIGLLIEAIKELAESRT
jgi:hypothetical protein